MECSTTELPYVDEHITIVNYDSSVINKFGASLIDDVRVIICDCHMFTVQVSGQSFHSKKWWYAQRAFAAHCNQNG